MVSVISGILVTALVIAAFMLSGAGLKQELSSLENTSSSQPALTLPGENPPGTDQNSLQNTWPLFAFWAFVGMISYYVVNMMIKILKEVREYNAELSYVNARRDAIIKITLEYFLFKAVMILIWLLFTDYFFRRLVPLCILAAHASTLDLISLAGISAFLTSFIVMAISMHLHTVLLRLVVGRPRVFTPFTYTD